MGRLQKGRIFERSGAFYVQYRVSEIVNGKPKRVQRSHRPLQQGRQILLEKREICEAVARPIHGDDKYATGESVQHG